MTKKGYKKVTREDMMQGLDKKPVPIIVESVKRFAISCQTCEYCKVPKSCDPCNTCIDYSEWE